MKKNINETVTAKKSKMSGVKIGIICAAAVLVAAGALFAIYNIRENRENKRQEIINSGVFHDGITVNGVALGGMNFEQAKAALAEQEAAIAAGLTFHLKSEIDPAFNFTLSPSTVELKLTYNTEDVLYEALSLGREGTLSQMQDEIADINNNGRALEIGFEVEDESLRAALEHAASVFDRPAADATFGIFSDFQDNIPLIKGGTTATFRRYDPLAKKMVDDEAIPENAVQEGRFYYIPEADGLVLDNEAMFTLLKDRIANRQYGDVEVLTQVTHPQVKLADVKSKFIMRSSFSTKYSRNTDRTYNLRKGAGILNATVLMPGEEFSTNERLGDRNVVSAGWKEAPGLIDGGARTNQQLGGGVCQISTTIYITVVQSDLEIVYRQQHSSKSDYVDGALDATIDSNRIDFKWKNNTNSPIIMFVWVDQSNRTMNTEIYGEPFGEISGKKFDRVEFKSKRLEILYPTNKVHYIHNSEVPNGMVKLRNKAKNGSVWEAYRIYYLGDKEVAREVENTSTYKPHDETWIYGRGWVKPTPTPLPTPTPPQTPVLPPIPTPPDETPIP